MVKKIKIVNDYDEAVDQIVLQTFTALVVIMWTRIFSMLDSNKVELMFIKYFA